MLIPPPPLPPRSSSQAFLPLTHKTTRSQVVVMRVGPNNNGNRLKTISVVNNARELAANNRHPGQVRRRAGSSSSNSNSNSVGSNSRRRSKVDYCWEAYLRGAITAAR